MAVATMGSIGPFKESEEEFEAYIARMKHYFIANDVDDKKQVSVLLTLIGPKGFALATNLLSPKNLTDCKFNDIVKELTDHYKPKKIVIYERFKFHSRTQQSNESIAEFLASLRTLAKTCEFDDAMLKEMLRDRFVVGLANRATQQILLSESKLTLNRAVELASARESAIRELEAASHLSNANSGSTVNKIEKSQFSKPKFPNNAKATNNSEKKPSATKPKNKCSGCGQWHWRRDCPFLNKECFKCNQKGHISKLCRTSLKNTNKISEGEPYSNNANPGEYDFVYNIDGSSAPPIKIDIELNGKPIAMELDTGSYYSVMSKETYLQLWPNAKSRPNLEKFDKPLSVYGGSPLSIEGKIHIEARLASNSRYVSTTIVVVGNKGPTLLGRCLMKELDLSDLNTVLVNKIGSGSEVRSRYPLLFSPGLGCYKDKEFSIAIDQTVQPKFCKARTVPYTLREKVNKELDRLVSENIISPVSHSQWAAPIVPVLKSDGSIRICGDYKLTINRAAHLDSYPIPRTQDLFSGLSVGTIFSKLDMSQAYAQLCLDEESRKFTVINTPKGLFQYNRLAFGISSAPGIFQRAMEELFQDMPQVLCYLDDVLIVGKNREDHDRLLEVVLGRLESTGLKLGWEKCSLGVREVRYLGFKIDAQGIHPTSEKVDAIRKAPTPTNVTQLRAYLGLLNFYRRFIPKAADILQPLNDLLKAKTPWNWGEAQEKAFIASKEALINSKALVHFDGTKPIVVAADSSSYGIGAVLYHRVGDMEYPVCFSSRTLSSAEKNYSQLEKEALAMVYALRQFHFYLWGQSHFTVVTDHKPLLGLFSPAKPIPPLASGRIQRWALLLQAYNFNLVHRSGALLHTADALSRLPVPGAMESTPIPVEWTMLVNFLDESPVTAEMVKEETRKDPLLSQVLRYVGSVWPSSAIGNTELTPYFRKKEELSIQCGCLLWGARIVIPPKLRKSILEELHANHFGASRMKELARGYLWWPNLDRDIEAVSGSCPKCLEKRPMPPKAELHPWEWPSAPWHRLHIDYAGPVDGHYFLVVVDAHSKWVEIHKTPGPTAKETIRWLSHSFSQFGLPISIVSDNGPCFTSSEFKEFMKNCGIKHITTAVYKPSTNGLAERMVRTFKNTLKVSKEPVLTTIDRFLFNYRLTPHSTTGVSPAELMFGRKLRSKLDLLSPAEMIASRVSSKQQKQVEHHSPHPRRIDLPLLSPVIVKNYSQQGPGWLPASVEKQTGPLSYQCRLGNGNIVKRHVDQIHPRHEGSPIKSSEPPSAVELPPEPEMHTGPVTGCNDEITSFSEITSRPAPSIAGSGGDVIRRSSRVGKPVDRLNYR